VTVPVTSLISALIPAPGEGVGVAGDELRRMERPAAGAARPRARCAAAGRPPAGTTRNSAGAPPRAAAASTSRGHMRRSPRPPVRTIDVSLGMV